MAPGARGTGPSPEMLRPAANDSLTASLPVPSCSSGRVLGSIPPLREARMEFRILGSMAVFAGDRPLALPTGRGRALLALLVLHSGEAVSTERLIDELWGEYPP